MNHEPLVGQVPVDSSALPAPVLLRLLHLVSPALPVGAYAYSQGLECAVSESWVHDEESAAQWLHGIARHAVGTLDLPLLLRLHRAWVQRDMEKVQQWNTCMIASRETQESRAEELHLGRALARVLVALDVAEAGAWETARPTFATLFALACVQWNIPVAQTLIGYLWAWTENQVLAAVKLVPLGQSAGQRLLHRMIGGMPALVERAAAIRDEEIGTSAISQLMASAMHETQYTRLFRS